jgi:hypothetical protein
MYIATNCLYTTSALFLKLSLFLLYIRIFHRAVNPLLHGFIYCGIAGVVLFYTVYLAAFLGVALPRGSETELLASIRSKQPRDRLILFQAVGSAVTDFYAWMLPIPMLWQLQMPARRKAGLCALFLSGLL